MALKRYTPLMLLIAMAPVCASAQGSDTACQEWNAILEDYAGGFHGIVGDTLSVNKGTEYSCLTFESTVSVPSAASSEITNCYYEWAMVDKFHLEYAAMTSEAEALDKYHALFNQLSRCAFASGLRLTENEEQIDVDAGERERSLSSPQPERTITAKLHQDDAGMYWLTVTMVGETAW